MNRPGYCSLRASSVALCTYWSATERGHVIYESRLELARLLFADFDTSVKRIIAQPFLLSAQVEAAVRRHVPDFLLLLDTGPIIVDVKPRLQLSKPKVSFTLAWAKDVGELHGWRGRGHDREGPVTAGHSEGICAAGHRCLSER
jgi:hypothetical protein